VISTAARIPRREALVRIDADLRARVPRRSTPGCAAMRRSVEIR